MGNRLGKFSQKSNNKYQFRCPVCGDSKKSQTKTRGTLYKKNDGLRFRCFNCHAGMRFDKFLEQYANDLYKEYLYESFCGRREEKAVVIPPRMKKLLPRQSVPAERIDGLPKDHIAVQYIKKRGIPEDKWSRLYYSPNFSSLVSVIAPGCEKKLPDDERLIIPFWDRQKKLIGVQGRSLNPKDKLRYITIIINEGDEKLYGLDTVDLDSKIPVVEGPIDSLFLRNAVATMDSSLYRVEKVLGKRDYLFIYDNQPLNPQITKALDHTVDLGYDVVVWEPNSPAKDINDMATSGVDIETLLKTRTFNGLKAKLEITRWKKTSNQR